MDDEFELEEIHAHVVDDFGSVSYECRWKNWPASSASLLSADELKDSADLLKDYHQSIGITDDYSEDEKLLKLTTTALKEVPQLNKKVWVTEVLGHSIDKAGELVYDCRFNTGEVVCQRPSHSFLEDFEKETLQTYIEANVPSSSSRINTPSRTAKRTRPSRTSSTNGSFRFSPTPESMISSDAKKIRAGSAGDRSRSPSQELLSEDSDASVMATKKSKRNSRSSNRKRQPTRKASDGSSASSTTPKNTRGKAAAAKRTATTSTSQVVVQKKAKTEPGYSNKLLQAIYKDENGVLQILTKNDVTGELTVEDLDASFRENPKYTYESLKYLYSGKLGNV